MGHKVNLSKITELLKALNTIHQMLTNLAYRDAEVSQSIRHPR